MNLEILKDLSYGMYIVTAKLDKNVGCVINTLCQITSENPLISISLNKNNYTNEIIKKTGKFAVSILSEKTDPKVIGTFGYKSSKDINKFAEVEYEKIDNLHVIKEESCGYLICEVTNFNDNIPMTYKYYHEVIKGKSPENAPTYIKEETKPSKNIYVCEICGYEYETEGELPNDFVCPLCGASKDKFYKK